MSGPEIVARAAWDTSGDRRRFSRPLQPHRVQGVVLHYPGDGGGSRAGLSAGQVGTLLRGYQRFHRATRGWPDLGYLLAVDQAGRLYHGAGPVVGAHSATRDYPAANQERVGVLLVIGDNEEPSPQARATVGWLREALPAGRVPGWPALPGCHDLHGHQNMAGASTRCPGPKTLALIRSGGFSGGLPTPGTPTTAPTTTTGGGDGKDYARREYGDGEVARLQRILALGGFYPLAAVDDRYGALTHAAVKAYQGGQRWPLVTVDGDWGPATDAHALWTRDLQIVLNRWRTALPRLRLDWDYGDLTEQRVAEWQRRNRAEYQGAVDGDAGPLTCRALGLRPHP